MLKMLMPLALALFWIAPLQATSTERPYCHHALEVVLSPENHQIAVKDTISLSDSQASRDELRISLHANLTLEILDQEITLLDATTSEKNSPGSVPRKHYILQPKSSWPDDGRIHLQYTGTVDHPLAQEGPEGERSFSTTPGTISETGIYLARTTAWIPMISEDLLTFSLDVTLPPGWGVVSQGERKQNELLGEKQRVLWECREPMEEIYLTAARFTEYTRNTGGILSQAFLRESDPGLANRYLDMTEKTLAMYGDLLGPYPYSKFSLVENFWETGWGMPSFTLLGPRIIRFPFILYSSYPHEILHNWWGNSVYVDRESGNWCEGLTAYLADHLMKEGQGQGAAYRRDTLKKYLDFVRGSLDFPLRDFRSRHSGATEAVGYGKSLMVWHMIRQEIGDEAFVSGLRLFYKKNKFRHASFDDLLECFSRTAGEDLQPRFLPWINQTGAPALSLHSIEVEKQPKRYVAKITIDQVQSGPTYTLNVPIAFNLEGEEEMTFFTLATDDRRVTVNVELPSRPLRATLDPEFDVFRQLDRREIPPSIGQIFGAEKITLILPGADDPISSKTWLELARSFQAGREDQVEIRSSSDLTELPPGRAVWLLGTSNRWKSELDSFLAPLNAGVSKKTARFSGASQASLEQHCFVFTAVHPQNPQLAIGWIGADLPASIPGLARKLPHYGKYSYLAFEGDAPTNSIKGQWESVGSPLTKDLSDEPIPGKKFPARAPLSRLK